MIKQGLLKEGEGFKAMDDLRRKYQVSRLQITEENKAADNSSLSQSSQRFQNLDESILSESVPEEGQDCKKSERPSEANNQHYVVTMEERKDFDNLDDTETPPILDLIYHEQNAMGLPIVFATNRDQSKLDDKIPQTPSYFKHLKSLKPQPDLLIKMLQGLMQAFPQYKPEDLMRNYIEKIPGISDKLTEEEVHYVIEQTVNGVSIMSEQPHTKLLTPQQTSKMFELMQNQQMDPTDLQSGYQSLDIYNDQQ